jgi:hypothetical protein
MATLTDSERRTERMEARRAQREREETALREREETVERPSALRETEETVERPAASIDIAVVDAAETVEMPAASTDDAVADDAVAPEYMLPEILNPHDNDELFKFFVRFCQEAKKKRHLRFANGEELRIAPAKKLTHFVAALVVHYT